MSVWNQLRVDLKSQMPLVAQLAQQIRLLVIAGKLIPNDKLPAVRELGAQLGISFHTVRAAYQQLETEGLVQTRQGVGSSVLAMGSSATRKRNDQFRSFTIGVMLPAFADFYAPMLTGLQEAASGDPFLFLLCDCRENAKLASNYFEQFVARGVDGIIVLSTPFASLPRAREIRRHSKDFPPLVFVDMPGFPPPLLTFDLQGGAYQAATHLLGHGHTKVGLIIPSTHWTNNAEKLKGYTRAFESAGIPLPENQIVEVPDYEIQSGVVGTNVLLDKVNDLTAIIAAGDRLAIGAMQALKEVGLEVPGDVALIGFDNTQVSTLVTPQLTTVNLPAHEMGQEAFRLLRAVMDGDGKKLEKALKAELVIRKSCGCE